MSKTLMIVIPELNDASIRRTSDGRCSVYDLLSVSGEQKSPRKVWQRLKEGYPEVVTKCHYFKFPGRGQRETPVTDKEGWLYILGLLPGVMGQKYRESAAKLVVQYLDADIKLALDVIDRNDNEEDLQQAEARVRTKRIRIWFAGVLKSHGVKDKGYAICTNNIYMRLFGGKASDLKAIRGLAKKDNLRDHFSISELNMTGFTEDLSGKKIKLTKARGNQECADICDYVAGRVASFAADVLSA